MGRMKWMEKLLQVIKIDSCKTHKAEINYRHVFYRSLIGGILLTIVLLATTQKKRKKVKEM